MKETIVVNGVDYVEEEVDGKTFLVKVDDSLKVNLTLTRKEAELVHTVLSVVGSELDLCYSEIVWFTEFLQTFTDAAVIEARDLSISNEWEVLYEDGEFAYFDRYITRLNGEK